MANEVQASRNQEFAAVVQQQWQLRPLRKVVLNRLLMPANSGVSPSIGDPFEPIVHLFILNFRLRVTEETLGRDYGYFGVFRGLSWLQLTVNSFNQSMQSLHSIWEASEIWNRQEASLRKKALLFLFSTHGKPSTIVSQINKAVSQPTLGLGSSYRVNVHSLAFWDYL